MTDEKERDYRAALDVLDFTVHWVCTLAGELPEIAASQVLAAKVAFERVTGDTSQIREPKWREERERQAAAAEFPLPRLPELPDDVHDAVESLKLAINRHRIAGWREASQDNVLEVLDHLRVVALSEWTTQEAKKRSP